MKNLKMVIKMKKTCTLALLLLIASSCAHQAAKPKGALSVDEGPKADVLSSESLWRYPQILRASLKMASHTPYDGLISCYNNNIDEGLKKLQDGLRHERKNPEYWNSLGTCYYLKGDMAKAEYFYQASLETAKGQAHLSSLALNNLGLVYLKLGLIDESISWFEKAIKNNSLTARFNLGLLYAEFGHSDKALTHLEKLHKLNSKDQEIILALGITYLQMGKVDLAIKKLLGLDPSMVKRAEASASLAHAYYLNGQLQKAQEALDSSDSANDERLKIYRQELEDRINLAIQQRG